MLTDVSAKSIGPNFRGQYRFSRNVDALPNIAEERRSQQIVVLLSNLLTPRSRLPFQTLTVLVAVLKCPAFYGQVNCYCLSNSCPAIVTVKCQKNPANTDQSTYRSSNWFLSFRLPYQLHIDPFTSRSSKLFLSFRFPYQLHTDPFNQGCPSGFFHSGFPINYALTHLHPGRPSGFFHSNFPISYTLTHLIKVVQVVSFIQASLSVTH